MTNYMEQRTVNFYTADYGKKYQSPLDAKISKEVLAKDDKGNVIEKNGYVYLTTNPEKYVKYKEDHNQDPSFNWLWTGGGYTTNPENHKHIENSWKLDKYNNVIGKDMYVSYKILVPKNRLSIEK